MTRWVFAAALFFRLLYLYDIRDNPFYLSPVIDAGYYHSMALDLAHGESRKLGPFEMPPGYPALLAVLYRITGADLRVAHLLQILLGAGAAALTFAVARRIVGPRAALVAAGLVSTSKALLYLEGDLLSTPLAIVLDLGLVLFLLRFLADGRKRDLAAAGLAAGLSALTVPTILIVVPVLAVWLAWRRRQRAAAALLLGMTFVPILPVTVRNLRASGEPVLISANGGINFYIGNNPDMDRTIALRPGPDWHRMEQIPLREAGITAPGARDRYFYEKGFGFWRASPGRALAQTGKKVLLLLHSYEIMRQFDFYYFRTHYSGLLRVPWWNFALLFALGLVGLVFARGGSPGERILQIFLLAYGAGVVLFFVTARYRAPLIPPLAIFAGRGVIWGIGAVRAGAFRQAAAAALLLVAAFAGSSVDLFGQDRIDEPEARLRVATAIEKSGDVQGALREYDAVARLDPGNALAAAHAAICVQRLGRPREAEDRYRVLLERHPDYVEAAVNLAVLAWDRGDAETAEEYFERAVRTDPFVAEAQGHYGLFLLEHGQWASAVEHLQQALGCDPTAHELWIPYARALVEAGQPARALAEIERGARVLPASAEQELVRGDALAALGRNDAARLAWESGLRLAPGDEALRRRLHRP